MKTKLLLLVAFVGWSLALNAQSPSITFTSALSSAQIGTTITVNYEYTVAADGNIYCAINRYNDWTWDGLIVEGVLSPAPAGTNVAGSFEFLIPSGTTPSADLTSPYNYKLVIQLNDAAWQYLAFAAVDPIELTSTSLSLENSKLLNSVKVFYSDNKMQIKGLNVSDKYELKIYDLLGREVKKIANDTHYINLSPSIYIAKLKVEGKGMMTSKFLVNF